MCVRRPPIDSAVHNTGCPHRTPMTFVPTSQIKLSSSATERDRAAPRGTPAPHLRIGGMHCASCVSRVEQALGSVPGVAEATANLATERANVRLASPVDPAALTAAVRAAGYDARLATSPVADDAE